MADAQWRLRILLLHTLMCYDNGLLTVSCVHMNDTMQCCTQCNQLCMCTPLDAVGIICQLLCVFSDADWVVLLIMQVGL